jgi:hypothetical protein
MAVHLAFLLVKYSAEKTVVHSVPMKVGTTESQMVQMLAAEKELRWVDQQAEMLEHLMVAKLDTL